jgi:hypothetical protein
VAVFSVPSTFSLNVLRRLVEAGAPPGERHQALALLSLLVAQMRPQSYEAEPSLSDLAAQFGAPAESFVSSVRWLSAVGAIEMSTAHRERRLCVTPNGRAPKRGQKRLYAGEPIVIKQLQARGPLIGKARA